MFFSRPLQNTAVLILLFRRHSCWQVGHVVLPRIHGPRAYQQRSFHEGRDSNWLGMACEAM